MATDWEWMKGIDSKGTGRRHWSKQNSLSSLWQWWLCGYGYFITMHRMMHLKKDEFGPSLAFLSAISCSVYFSDALLASISAEVQAPGLLPCYDMARQNGSFSL